MNRLTLTILIGCLALSPSGLGAQSGSVREARVGDLRLQFIDWGGRGQAVVLVPGGCDTAHVFGDVAPRLAGSFRVLSLTPRGCAGSDAPTEGYALDDQLRELAGFLDSQGIRRAVLAGHSSGGGKITRFARLYPDRVERLVYFDTVYSYIADGLEEGINAAITRKLSRATGDRFERFRATEQAWELGVWSPAMERNARLSFEHKRPDGWWASFRADMEAGRYFESAVHVPALMFFASGLDTQRLKQFDAATQATLRPLVDQTEAKRREQVEAFRRNGPHVQIVEMTGTSHYCFAHKPDEIAEAVIAFLRRQ